MREIKGKYYYCKRMRLMEFLHNKGLKFIKTVPDLQDANKIIWVYENTPELNNGLSEYYFLRKANADLMNDVR